MKVAEFFLRVQNLAYAIEYKNWRLLIQVDELRNHSIYLQWMFDAPDAKTGAVESQKSRKWYLSPHMTDSEIVLTAFKSALTAEEHECREHFKFLDRRIFNPHIDVRALWSVCDVEDARP